MAKIAGIDVADGLGTLAPVSGKLSLADFHGDTGMYEMYTAALAFADSLDKNAAIDIAETSSDKKPKAQR